MQATQRLGYGILNHAVTGTPLRLKSMAHALPRDHWPRKLAGLTGVDRHAFDPRTVPLYLLAAAELFVIMIAVAGGRFEWDQVLFLGLGRDFAAFLAFSYAARWLGFERLAAPVEWVMLSLVTMFLGSFVAVVLAATAAAGGRVARHERPLAVPVRPASVRRSFHAAPIAAAGERVGVR